MKSFLTIVRSFISSLSKLTLRNKIIIGVIVVVLVGGGLFFIQSNGNTDGKLLTVQKGDFVQQVSVSGKIVATNDVDLGFDQGGRVEKIFVAIGDTVSVGQRLASLSLGTLYAELQSADAQLRIKQAEYENTGINLDEVKKQQDTAVAGARRTLLSSGLVATPGSASYTATPPAISGLYLGDAEGTYKISIEKGVQSGVNFKLNYFGLEENVPTVISEKTATALGTKGLYVSFPDGVSAYQGTTWYVSLPNQKSATYGTNYNAYQEALRARDKAIADAEAELRERSQGTTIAAAILDSARADVARIQALIAQRSITAPFPGVVSKIPVDMGETVTPNQNVVSVIGEGLFIETYVPEINISLVHVGNPAAVTLDAYGDDVPFTAQVVSIDPDETVRDGVSAYRIILHFAGSDERIRSGMTANVLITTEQKTGVISVPQGIIELKSGEKFVTVLKNGKQEKRKVTTGSVSAVGSIEILSGLSEGEVVVLKGE